MRKWFRAAAAAAVLAVGAAGSGAAWADHSMDTKSATCAPAGTSLALTAQDHKFDKDCLAVPAGESFTIRFDNRDSDRHNVAILPSHTSMETLFQGDIIPGPKTTVYAVPNMKAGTYHFHCEVHPNLMNGTFIVAAAPDAGTPAAAPAPGAATGTDKQADAMPAETPKAAPAPAPKTAAAPAPAAKPAPAAAPAAPAPAAARTPSGAAAAPKTAAAGSNLPHTGPSSRPLLLLAGFALAAGGLAVLGGARRGALAR